MVDEGLRSPHRRATGLEHPEAEVGVLAGAEAFVQSADLLEIGLPVEDVARLEEAWPSTRLANG